MKKYTLLVFSLICFLLYGCDETTSTIYSSTQPPSNSETNQSVKIESYQEELAKLDSEYNNRLQAIDNKHNSDLSSWKADHASFESDLDYLEEELSIVENLYTSQINSLSTQSYKEAEAAGKKAYNDTYNKKISQSGGYGSSSAKLAAEQAQYTAYEKVINSYKSEISSLQKKKESEMNSVQSKINIQKSKITSSNEKKKAIEEEYKNNKSSLDSWYESQKQIIDKQYN